MQGFFELIPSKEFLLLCTVRYDIARGTARRQGATQSLVKSRKPWQRTRRAWYSTTAPYSFFYMGFLSYGIYHIFSGYVISCRGAAGLNSAGGSVPSIMELLHWQFGQTKGEKSFRSPLKPQAWRRCSNSTPSPSSPRPTSVSFPLCAVCYLSIQDNKIF